MEQTENENLYEKCVRFHGHSCGGLLIGYRAALFAMELLGIDGRASDEELVCIAENDACGIDAIQALLGCTAGKGNLIIKRRGKQAFNIYDRRSGRSFRIALKDIDFKSKEEKRKFMISAAPEEIFSKSEARYPLPANAEIFSSLKCASCGEKTAEPWLRVKDGKYYCVDCYTTNSIVH